LLLIVKGIPFLTPNIGFVLLALSHSARSSFIPITIGLIEISCFAEYTPLAFVALPCW